MKRRHLLGITLGVLGILLPLWEVGVAAEKKFPSRPIQVIVPFVPGETDNLLRPFVEKMPDFLGQPVTFVYKPGAAGGTGSLFVANSKPDGYTLVASSQSSMVLLPLANKDLGYTPEAFTAVSCLVEGYINVGVLTNARWKTIQDLVADAKKNPEKISYSSTGTFGITHIAAEAFCKEAGIKMIHVPTGGAGAAVTAMLGGHVDISMAGSGPTFPHIKAGTVRSLMIFNARRAKAIPDVPCAKELSYPVIPLNYGILAPKGTPKQIIEILAQSIKKVIEKNGPLLEDRLSQLGAQINYLGPEEHAAFLKSQYDYFGKVLKAIHGN
ncbi:MAG: tripartite tricarboxylate transporter substrate binding protein [Thermodesulfobacteriota bacterium]